VGESLDSLLIRPIQRIPRYKLFLTDLYNNTNEWHKDYNDCKKAVLLIEETAAFINQSVHRKEGNEKLIEIENRLITSASLTSQSSTSSISSSNLKKRKNLIIPSRRFIFEGDVKKVSRQDYDKRHLFLFNDIIVIGFFPFFFAFIFFFFIFYFFFLFLSLSFSILSSH
jgi:FYVE/RhoGEF/PH domain-containing protein 5/6